MQNEILVGRLNGILHKLLDMKEGSPAPVLGAEILPAIILENDRLEYHFLGGGTLAMAGAESPAVVGALSGIALQNPVGSGRLVITERIFMRSTGGALMYFQVFSGTTALASVSARNTRDTRLAPNIVGGQQTGIAGAVLFGSSAVSVITAAGGFRQAPNEWFEGPLEIVLGPGTFLYFEQNTANNPLRVSLTWRERALEPAETR